MDIENDTFKPFMKPNNTPLYVHKLSNDPPNVTKNIPAAVYRRLSSISSNEAMFNSAAPTYQEALRNSGYSYELKFNPKTKHPKNLLKLNILGGVLFLLPFFKQELNLSQISDSES